MKTRSRNRKTNKTKKGGKPFNYYLQKSLGMTSRLPTMKNIVECKEAQDCMLFGNELGRLASFFDNFTLESTKNTKKYITRPSGGTDSVNSDIAKIRFNKETYNCYALLKNSKDRTKDNLLYEYKIGMIINYWCSIFPCFLQTFGIYNNISVDKYKKGIEEPFTLNNMFSLKSINHIVENSTLSETCNDTKNFCLLTQYLDGSRSLNYMKLNSGQVWDNPKHELPYVLFQLFYTLNMLTCLRFQHNDLHANNILVYTLPSPIEFEFKMKDTTPVKFKSKFLLKIIDYGRCMVNDIDNEQLQHIVTLLYRIEKERDNDEKEYDVEKERDDEEERLAILKRLYPDRSHEEDPFGSDSHDLMRQGNVSTDKSYSFTRGGNKKLIDECFTYIHNIYTNDIWKCLHELITPNVKNKEQKIDELYDKIMELWINEKTSKNNILSDLKNIKDKSTIELFFNEHVLSRFEPLKKILEDFPTSYKPIGIILLAITNKLPTTSKQYLSSVLNDTTNCNPLNNFGFSMITKTIFKNDDETNVYGVPITPYDGYLPDGRIASLFKELDFIGDAFTDPNHDERVAAIITKIDELDKTIYNGVRILGNLTVDGYNMKPMIWTPNSSTDL